MWAFLKLMLWGLVWLVTWPIVTSIRCALKKKRLDNCFTFAIREWQEKDGYLVIRWCRSNRVKCIRWPHFLWLDIDHHEHLTHFLPKKQAQSFKYFPDPFFEGKIQRGDPKETLEN